MKRLTNWKWLACFTWMLCALAVTASAEDLDLSVAGITVDIVGDGYQVTPMINLANQGNLTAHVVKIAIYYGPILVQVLDDTVTYVQDHHTCWNFTWPNCGQGECLDIYGFGAYYEGACQDIYAFFHCGCTYTMEPFVEWIPYGGQPTLTVVVDPDHEVPEVDEGNNSMTVDLEPIANESLTWTTVKSIYR